MRLQDLATLSAVGQHGSFASAAEAIGLTPSAVSLQMKRLEDYFGQPLFDRSARSVRLTDFAREVAATVERATTDIEALRHRRHLAPRGLVRLGVTESALTSLLPVAWTELRRRAPGIDLHVERGSTPDLMRRLRAGEVEAAVLIRSRPDAQTRLLWTDLLKEPLVLVAPADVPGANVEALLRAHDWLRLDRLLVAGKLASRFVDGLVPRKQAALDLPSVDAILAMVALGAGVSVVPRLRPAQLRAFAVREVPLGRRAPIRQMALVKRGAEASNRLLEVVEGCLVDAARAAVGC